MLINIMMLAVRSLNLIDLLCPHIVLGVFYSKTQP